jgi:hypothetical protein
MAVKIVHTFHSKVLPNLPQSEYFWYENIGTIWQSGCRREDVHSHPLSTWFPLLHTHVERHVSLHKEDVPFLLTYFLIFFLSVCLSFFVLLSIFLFPLCATQFFFPFDSDKRPSRPLCTFSLERKLWYKKINKCKHLKILSLKFLPFESFKKRFTFMLGQVR